LIAAAVTPASTVFTGFVVIARDAFVYQALWRAGWHGAWLFHPLYSSESQPGVLIYAWYLWTGHLVGFLPAAWLYHAARLAAGGAALAAIFRLAATLYRPAALRWWAFLLAVLGGGVGVLLPHPIVLGPLTLTPTETSVAGTGVAEIVSMAPHLAWATALLCWVFYCALRQQREASVRGLVAGISAWVGLELIYPQLAVLAGASLLAFGLVRGSGRVLRFTLLGGAAVAPYLGYLLLVEWRTPQALIGVGATAQVPFHFDVGDPVGFVVISHLGASVLIAIAAVRRRIRGDLLLPAAWILLMTLFMFAPGLRAVMGRAYLASSIPFGLLGAAGLAAGLRLVRSIAWRRRALALVLAVSCFYGIFSLVEPYAIAIGRMDPRAEYEPAGEAAVLAWLAPRSHPDDVVLSTYLAGLFIPAQTNARAYVGHPDQTVDVKAKSDAALAFFTSWDQAARGRFLSASGVDFVLATGDDSARLRGDPRLRELTRSDDAVLYRVLP
jgi:hypothetical protein